LPARHEAEEQHDGRVLARQGALRLHAPAEFFVERSIVFVVRTALHCALGNRKNVRSSSPPSPEARHDPRTSLTPGALEGRVGAAGAIPAGVSGPLSSHGRELHCAAVRVALVDARAIPAGRY
jgi:hypothetical protein